MYCRLFLLLCGTLYILCRVADAVDSKPRSCKSQVECCYNTCCVSNIRPIGRKKRSLMSLTGNTGTCQQLGKKNDFCLMRNQNLDTKGSFFVNCPCKAPLTCIADGGHDIPLGPTGTCGLKLTKTG